MRLAGILTAATLASAGGAAFADTVTRAEQAACRPDVRRFCGHITRGDDQKYRDCLQSHFFDLSQKCRQVLLNHQNRQ
jgi:hypothetical protein